jgi:predicted HD superfamily hydrolase involved in NAD metabolism
MRDLADIYSLDGDKAALTGLLHDVAKDLSHEEQLAIAEEAGVRYSFPCESHPVYLHATVGAHMVSKHLGVSDPTILDAISTHSYSGDGVGYNSAFSRCLRFADILAPTQEWVGMERLRSLVYTRQFEEAVLLQSVWLIEYFESCNIPIHPNLAREVRDGSERLGVGDEFFRRW